MIKSITDSHRCMYRNARIRALDLSDRTTPIPFYDITDDQIPTQGIGYEVRTDAAGYIFYSNGQQQVECLAIKQSAIIQVDLFNNNAWDIEWILRVDNDNDLVHLADVHKVYDKDGNLVWNPLAGDWHLPDWVERSELQSGEWAEGELVVDSADSYDLPIDKWTHTIVFKSGHAASHRLLRDTGRYGQVLHIYNFSSEPVLLGSNLNISAIPITTQVELKPYEQSTALYFAGLGWIISSNDSKPNTYIHNAVDPLIIDLDANHNLESIVVNTAPGDYKIILKSTVASPRRPLTIINNTASSLRLIGRKTEGGITTDREYDQVLSRSLMPITAGDGYAYLQTNSNYSIVHDTASATLTNDHIHVIYLSRWEGTVELTTPLLGYTFPVQVVLKTNDTSDTPGESRTLTVKLNNHIIFTSTQSYTANTHYAGELMVALAVRQTKVPGDPADPTTLNVDSYNVTVFDGSFV